MKKIICIIVSLTALVAMFSGCGKRVQPLDTSSMPAAVTFESPELKCSADENKIPVFTFAYEYGDDTESPVWLWNQKGMTGAALVGLDYSVNPEKPTAGETIYTFGNIESSEGILLYMQIDEGAPQVGISYSYEDESFVYGLSASENGSAPVAMRLQ